MDNFVEFHITPAYGPNVTTVLENWSSKGQPAIDIVIDIVIDKYSIGTVYISASGVVTLIPGENHIVTAVRSNVGNDVFALQFKENK